MNSPVLPPVTAPTSRALVLGGGGAAGNAWLVGVVAGLHTAGVDLTTADLFVGTSAGATAAAQLASAPPSTLFERTVAAAPPGRAAPAGPRPDTNHLQRLLEVIGPATGPRAMRQRIGALTLAAAEPPPGPTTEQWRAVVATRLPQPAWPQRRVLVTAVDARSGEPVAFDRDSGVDLVDAVAASTSNGIAAPAYRIGEHWYLDGGYRRNENADLAAGHARVVVLSPFGGRSLHPPAWRMDLAAQVDDLRAGGSAVETVVPDAAALSAFGPSMTDPSVRPAAARAGHAQGLDLAARLAGFWR